MRNNKIITFGAQYSAKFTANLEKLYYPPHPPPPHPPPPPPGRD